MFDICIENLLASDKFETSNLKIKPWVVKQAVRTIWEQWSLSVQFEYAYLQRNF